MDEHNAGQKRRNDVYRVDTDHPESLGSGLPGPLVEVAEVDDGHRHCGRKANALQESADERQVKRRRQRNRTASGAEQREPGHEDAFPTGTIGDDPHDRNQERLRRRKGDHEESGPGFGDGEHAGQVRHYGTDDDEPVTSIEAVSTITCVRESATTSPSVPNNHLPSFTTRDIGGYTPPWTASGGSGSSQSRVPPFDLRRPECQPLVPGSPPRHHRQIDIEPDPNLIRQAYDRYRDSHPQILRGKNHQPTAGGYNDALDTCQTFE